MIEYSLLQSPFALPEEMLIGFLCFLYSHTGKRKDDFKLANSYWCTGVKFAIPAANSCPATHRFCQKEMNWFIPSVLFPSFLVTNWEENTNQSLLVMRTVAEEGARPVLTGGKFSWVRPLVKTYSRLCIHFQ